MSGAPYVPPGSVEISGKTYVRNPKGLTPIELVKAQDLMRDQLVRELFDEAVALREQLRAFKAKAYGDVQAHLDLVAELYGAKARPGGDKGNVTLATIDGLMRVQIQVSDLIQFESAPLQAAKALVDECLSEWSADANAELRAVVANAFKVDKEGELSRSALLGVLRWEIADPRWMRAMAAIRDSIHADGTKTYVRVHHRPAPEAVFDGVSLDLATA